MGRIAEQEVPEGNQVAQSPIPEVTTATPDNLDAESYALTAGQFRRGLRTGFNQVGAMANAFIGSMAEAGGLTDFAHKRFKDAEDMVEFSEAFAPDVRTYRDVKDFNDLAKFVEGLMGQAAATMAPAVAGAGVGRALGGLRGAFGGAAAGSFVPNAGEQALRTKDAPVSAQTKAGNVLATGAATSALDMIVPGGTVGKMGRGAAKESFKKAVGKGVAIEGVTEGTQEAIGQGMHTLVDPSRDKSGDTDEIIDSTIAGAVGGGGLTGTANILSKGAGKIGDAIDSAKREQSVEDVERTLGADEKAPIDEDDISEIVNDPSVEADLDSIGAKLEERGAQAVESLTKVWEKVKADPKYKKFEAFRTDPEVRAEFTKAAKDRFNELEIKPKIQKGFEDIKSFVKGAKEAFERGRQKELGKTAPKESKIRTAIDHSIYDLIHRNYLDEDLQRNLTPEQKIELSDYVKFVAMYEHGKREEVEGPGAPDSRYPHTFLSEGQDAPFTRESDRGTFKRSIPDGMLQYFGDRSIELLNEVNAILGKADMAKKRDFTKDVKAHQDVAKRRTTKFQDIVRNHLVAKYSADPAARDRAAEIIAPRLLDYVLKGPNPMGDPTSDREREARFQVQLEEVFGDNKDRVMEVLDRMRKRMTVDQETFFEEDDEVTGTEVENAQEETAVRPEESEDVIAEGQGKEIERQKVVRSGAFGDERIGVPVDYATAESWYRALTARDSEYDSRRVSFTVEQTEDGRYTVEAKERIGDDTFDDKAWERIKEKKGKSGLEEGVITIARRVKNKLGKVQRVEQTISLPNLASQMIREVPRQEAAGMNYAHQIVARGLAKLMGDPSVIGFGTKQEPDILKGAQGWDLPDDALVAIMQGRRYTWKDVKDRINISPDELRIRRWTSNAVEQAQEAPNIDVIRYNIIPFIDEKLASIEREVTEVKIAAYAKRKYKDGEVVAKDKKAERNLTRAMSWLSRMQGAKESIMEELERRSKEGDAPRSDVRGLVEDERKVGTAEASTPIGERYVEADTGADVIDTRVASTRTGKGGPLSGGHKTTPSTVQGTGTLAPKLPIGEKDSSRMDPKNPSKVAGAQRKARADTMPKVDEVPGSMPSIDKVIAEAKPEPKTEPKVKRTPYDFDKFKKAIEESGKEESTGDDISFAVNAFVDSNPTTAELLKASDYFYANMKADKFVEEEESGSFEPMYTLMQDRLRSGIEASRGKLGSDYLAGLQEILDKEDAGIDEIMDNIKDLAGALKEFADKQGKLKLSTMNVGKDGEVSAEEQSRVKDFLAKILGPKAAVDFVKGMEAAGSFAKLKGVETIQIALNAMDAMGVARHEAAHALISRLIAADPSAAHTLLAAAGSPTVVTRLRQLLKDHPSALEQLSDPEERLAYMYQFWAAGLLKVGPNTKGVFNKVKAFFRRVAGIWSETHNQVANVDRAEAIFDLFEQGRMSDPNTVAEVLRDHFPKSAYEKATEMMPGVVKFAEKSILTAEGMVRGANIPVFNEIMDKFFTSVGQQDKGPGYLQTRYMMLNRFHSKLHDILENSTEEQQRAALEELQAEDPALYSPMARRIRVLLDEAFQYMIADKDNPVMAVEWDEDQKKYVEHDLREVKNYFPRMFNRTLIREKKDEFIAHLVSKGLTPRKAADVASKIVGDSKVDPDESDYSAGLTYFAPNSQHRTLKLKTADIKEWLHKDLSGTMHSYLNYVTRRTEYAKRFGNMGQEIADAVSVAEAQGASTDQIKTFNQAVMAMEGSLGFDIKPEMKQILGGIVTYQNYRLLPLSLFASLVDPTGIAVRGGGIKEAFGAFVRGVSSIIKENKDEAYELAKTVGSISASNDMHMLQEAYGTQYLTQWQRKANAFLFKWNGMENWNRQMRIAATAAAQRFIIKHAAGKGDHSERYLRELGLTKEDVRMEGDAMILTDKIKQAIVQWVDGAILRPNAAIRPIWMSDPHWMLIAHLKQFTYSFQKTIVARVVHEIENGNYTPAYVMLSYIPLMVAADIMRYFLTPGGGDDEAMERLGLGGIMWRGVQRAGLLGPGQYALDAYGDLGHGKIPVASIMGPSVQQLYDFGKATAGYGSIGLELKKALPGYVLVR